MAGINKKRTVADKRMAYFFIGGIWQRKVSEGVSRNNN